MSGVPVQGGFEIRAVALDDPVARALELDLIAETTRRYGARGQNPLSSGQFDPPGGCFVLALDGEEPVGCGGLRRLGERVAELKRMYVVPGARRRGVARQMLEFLEACAATVGYEEVWLETGTEQPEAIDLYSSAGYVPITPYGEFRVDARSRCFARSLLTGPPRTPASFPS